MPGSTPRGSVLAGRRLCRNCILIRVINKDHSRDFVIIRPIAQLEKCGLLTSGGGPSAGVACPGDGPLDGSGGPATGRGWLSSCRRWRQRDVRREPPREVLALRRQLLSEDLEPAGRQQAVNRHQDIGIHKSRKTYQRRRVRPAEWRQAVLPA